MSRIVPILALAGALFGCTAHYPVNQPLEQGVIERNRALREAVLTSPRSDTLGVSLAFSGGGTRAAAFSYGVLEVLRDTEVNWEGKRRRLVDEIDGISSVSGGSFTAAYFGLYGDRIFEDFERDFLKRDVQGHLTGSLFSPANWPVLGSALYNRSELAADYYDEILFDGATFSDIAARNGPSIEINATDIGLGVQFSFTPGIFNMICSDLASFPVSRAVTASSAVPVLFTSLTIHNYAGTCDYKLPDWAQEILDKPDFTSRRYRLARLYSRYLDREDKPYIHLYDGGLSDNLGVRPMLNRLSLAGDAWTLAKLRGFEDIQRVLLIAVNSQTELDPEFDRSEQSLSLAATIETSSSIPLNEYSFESMAMLRRSIDALTEQVKIGRCAERKEQGRSLEGCDDIKIYLVEVDFDRLRDPELRKRLKRLPTSFRLAPEEVDELRAAAAELLAESEVFQAFLRDMQAASR